MMSIPSSTPHERRNRTRRRPRQAQLLYQRCLLIHQQKQQWKPQYTERRSSSPLTIRLDNEVQQKILACFSMFGSQVEALGDSVLSQMQEAKDRQGAYRQADRDYLQSQLDALQQSLNQDVRAATSATRKENTSTKRVRASKLPDAVKNNPNRPFFLVSFKLLVNDGRVLNLVRLIFMTLWIAYC